MMPSLTERRKITIIRPMSSTRSTATITNELTT